MDTGASPALVPPTGGTRSGRPSPRALLATGTGVALVFIALLILDTLTPFVVGLLLIYLLAPAVDRVSMVVVRGRRVPRWLAILLLYLVVVIVIAIGIALVVRPMSDQVQRFAQQVPGWLDSLHEWYLSLGLPEWLRSAIDRLLGGVSGAEDGQGERTWPRCCRWHAAWPRPSSGPSDSSSSRSGCSGCSRTCPGSPGRSSPHCQSPGAGTPWRSWASSTTRSADGSAGS